MKRTAYWGIRSKAISLIALIGVFGCIGYSFLAYRSSMDEGISIAQSEAHSLINRTQKIFQVSTDAFYNDFIQAKGNPAEQKRVLEEWLKIISGIDHALTAPFGKNAPHVRLAGDEALFGIVPLGEGNHVTSDFQKKAAQSFLQGNSFYEEIGTDQFQLAVPLYGSVHPGCIECHIGAVHGIDAELPEEILLGMVDASIPLAPAIAVAKKNTMWSVIAFSTLLAILIIAFYLLLDRVILVPLRKCRNSITALARQEYHQTCDVKTKDEIGEMAQAINTTMHNIREIFKDKVFFYEGLLDAIPHPVFSCGNGGKVNFANRALGKLLDKSPEEIKGTYSELIPCDYSEENTDDTPRTFLCESFPGKIFNVNLADMFNRQEEKIGYVEVLHDITSLKAIQGKLQEAIEEAQRSNLAKSQFLANVSHEIRTPMTAILGYAELLRTNLTEKEQAEATHAICRNSKHLLCIINDILDLTRIESGKMTLQTSKCHLKKLIQDAITAIRFPAKKKGLSVGLRFDSPLPNTIQTDPTRLKQMLINLLGNAVKFTDTGSVVLGVKLLQQTQDHPILQFDVSDTGIGIQAEDIERLFRPFEQGDPSMSRKFGGVGLGLAITKRLATLLGGELTVKKNPDQGVTFVLTTETGPLQPNEITVWSEERILSYLKMNQKAKRKKVPSTRSGKDTTISQPPLPLAGSNILLAEDGVDNQRLLSLLLQKAGARVTVTENGQAAVDTLLNASQTDAPFDLILMDMQMPVLDGYQATIQLRSLDVKIPIVALTAHAMVGDSQKCLASGCDAYLTKPIERNLLIQTVQELLDAAAQKKE